ncbi:hypothetical protein BDQ17DRAFT_1364001 [Cyathus striatus]|nr:hypothetical protein BDQ17DRAFT_1364001 [Cyathus striatus]
MNECRPCIHIINKEQKVDVALMSVSCFFIIVFVSPATKSNNIVSLVLFLARGTKWRSYTAFQVTGMLVNVTSVDSSSSVMRKQVRETWRYGTNGLHMSLDMFNTPKFAS